MKFRLAHRALHSERALIAQSKIFDPSLYLELNPDVARAGIDPLQHYMTSGGVEGRNPHSLFDGSWYLQQNPDVAAAGVNPLLHYLHSGWKEGRSPHPLFDIGFYLKQNPDVAKAGIEPLRHYLTCGGAEARNPHPLFDGSYYVRQYPDVITSGANPLIDYLSRPDAGLRSPHPLFDCDFYRSSCPDAAMCGINLLTHYLTKGVERLCSPHPLFDVRYYLDHNPHLVPGVTDPIRHYLCGGAAAGCDPCELFDSSFYLQQYPQIARAGLNPLAHYVTQGVIDGYDPNPLFDTSFYLEQHPDIAAAGTNPLLHFITYGALEGRMPNPLFDPVFYYKHNPEVKQAKINALAHYLREGGAEQGRDPGPLFGASSYISKHPELRNSGVNPLVHFLNSQRQSAEIFLRTPKAKHTVRQRLGPANSSYRRGNRLAGPEIDLLLDLTNCDLPEIRNTLVSLCAPERLGELVSAATILVPPEISHVDAAVPSGWRVIPAPRPILGANEALADASETGHHLLVLLGPVLPESEAIRALTLGFQIDPHFGITMGRRSDPATGEILKLGSDLVDPELVNLPRSVLACLPEFYVLPETLSPCFVVRDLLVTNLGLLDERYETLSGALLDYLSYARRCGFRCAVLNRVAIAESSGVAVDAIDGDILKLASEHASLGRAKIEFSGHSLHLHENLLARAVSPNRSVQRSLLLDARGIPDLINGTSEAVLGLCDGLLQANHDWTIALAATDGPAQFHKLAERYPKWRIISPGHHHYFTAALLPTQAWTVTAIVELHCMALFNFYTMFDTIAWDVFPARQGLEPAWNFLSEYADGLLYISQYTRDRFATRFPLSRETPGCVAYLSFDPAGYTGPSNDNGRQGDSEFLFVIGNPHDHKHVGPTVDLLTSAFPFQPIKVIGLTRHPSSFVHAVESGQVPQSEIDYLFARAKLVVFPSFYEGFGFPILRGLSYGRTVIARHSDLLIEIAGRYRGPGRLVSFRTEDELVEVIARLISGGEIADMPLGGAVQAGEKPAGWKETALQVLHFMEEQVKNVDKSRWPERERAIRQMTAYAG